eukprot:158767-Lingulodinium_polyedra.AAC.1
MPERRAAPAASCAALRGPQRRCGGRPPPSPEPGAAGRRPPPLGMPRGTAGAAPRRAWRGRPPR